MADADEVIFLWLNGLAGTFAPLDTAIQWVVSDYLVPAAMAMTLVALWFAGTDLASRTRNQVGALAALGSMAISSGVVFAINAMYFRTRPFDDLDVSLLFYEPTDSSFPANSAAAMFGMAAAVWGFNRRLGSGMFVVAGLFGLSRVVAGVHYPLDVVASALIGIVVAYVVLKVRDLLGPIPTMYSKEYRILHLE